MKYSEMSEDLRTKVIESKNLELNHIQLELSHGRDNHFRQFVDQWFCYKNGYVTSTGSASWSKIILNEWYSEAALEEGPKGSIVQKEHIVPLNVITETLRKLRIPSIDEIEDTLIKTVMFATITKEENQLLNDAGLKDSMPAEYYDQTSDLYKDPLARYKKAGISLTYTTK